MLGVGKWSRKPNKKTINMTLNPNTRIYIAGHRGMVGSAVWRALEAKGYTQLISRTSSELDLRNQADVEAFFSAERPEVVIDAAARVGGVLANDTEPYPFLMQNLQIQNNLIDASVRHDVGKFIFLGSSCIYPKFAPQPMLEEHLLTGPLEPTNQWYAVGKIAGVKACEAIRRQYGKDFLGLMPTNLYGINDNFDLHSSHVLPALLRKFHEARVSGGEEVVVWGTGSPLREFLHVDDLAQAVVFAMENALDESLYNVGSGDEVSIKQLAELIAEITGFEGTLTFDTSKPDGTPRKLMDSGKMNRAGWSARISLREGIERTYKWWLNQQ